jgi:DNA helicase-2/ATP-dependent DNA helicase PcrA
MLEQASADDLGAAPATAVASFRILLEEERAALRAAESAASLPPPEHGFPPLAAWADALLKRLGIEDALRGEYRDRTIELRIDNVRDVVGTIARYERRVWADVGADEWEAPSLMDALARLALAEMDDNEEEEREAGGVTQMTLHSAKGLEFSDVFIVGLEEGILPHARSLNGEGADTVGDPLAEERRLLYVGITRARQRLGLSYCMNRRRGGSAVVTLPSRYLDEIPQELIEVRDAATPLSPEESTSLRVNFFAGIRDMLGADDDGG